jgi:hypothetical protein
LKTRVGEVEVGSERVESSNMGLSLQSVSESTARYSELGLRVR